MSSRILYVDEVFTQFGLVSIRDFDTEDNPVVESGEEEVVALPGHLFVSTRSDTEGAVRIEVHVGECEIPGMRAIFDHFMIFQSSVMCISDAASPDEENFRLPRSGEWGVKIYVSGSPKPNRVMIFLGLGEWQASGGKLSD